jgi:phosphohistidine phosphatase
MDIYLIRHAAAAELDKEIVEDGFRYLSPSGRAQSFEVANKLKNLEVSFELIVSSPLVRAVQTAEIFSHVLAHKGEFKTAVELIGGASFGKFLQMLKRNSRYKSVACFGHSPDVNHYAANLLKYDHSKELNINFKNCGVCRIDYDNKKEKGEFVWFLKSDTMELIKTPL